MGWECGWFIHTPINSIDIPWQFIVVKKVHQNLSIPSQLKSFIFLKASSLIGRKTFSGFSPIIKQVHRKTGARESGGKTPSRLEIYLPKIGVEVCTHTLKHLLLLPTASYKLLWEISSRTWLSKLPPKSLLNFTVFWKQWDSHRMSSIHWIVFWSLSLTMTLGACQKEWKGSCPMRKPKLAYIHHQPWTRNLFIFKIPLIGPWAGKMKMGRRIKGQKRGENKMKEGSTKLTSVPIQFPGASGCLPLV